MRRSLQLTVLVLAGFGGYTIWKRYAAGAKHDALSTLNTLDRRVNERAELTVDEWAAGSDDPVAQATAILADSDERTELSRDTPGIEHRTSEDTVEP